MERRWWYRVKITIVDSRCMQLMRGFQIRKFEKPGLDQYFCETKTRLDQYFCE
jgi:hypothetical protein